MLNRSLPWFAAAGASWFTAQALEPDEGSEGSVRLAHIAAHRGQENLAALFFFLAGAALVLASCATVRAAVTGRGGRLIGIGQCLLAIAALWLVGGRGMGDVLGWAATDRGVPRDAGATLIDTSGGIAFTVLTISLVALLAAPILLAVGLRRANLASWLPLALWITGIAIFVATEFRTKPLQILGIALAAVALTLLGHAVDQARSSSTARLAQPQPQPQSAPRGIVSHPHDPGQAAPRRTGAAVDNGASR